MASMTENWVMPGFSATNRALLYGSLITSPVQAVFGLGSNSPLNLGFLAYSWYQQYLWYLAARERNLHALSILVDHLNIVFCLTALAAVPCGNHPMGILLGLGTAGVVIMNNVTAWISWKTNLPEGDGVYRFFFFGYRTLSPGWRKFLFLWAIGDTFLTALSVILAIGLGIFIPMCFGAREMKGQARSEGRWWWNDWWFWLWVVSVSTAAGSLVLFIELTVKRNKIMSNTDMVSVYLFAVQAALLVGTIVWNCACTLWNKRTV
ncbi:hypothetical protein NMY22_g2610 [Coprinellus aureogranulatus]|nr:hypothetical protein NMY22_g2610 [Coprinellus aureogranulatus]